VLWRCWRCAEERAPGKVSLSRHEPSKTTVPVVQLIKACNAGEGLSCGKVRDSDHPYSGCWIIRLSNDEVVGVHSLNEVSAAYVLRGTYCRVSYVVPRLVAGPRG
jgi:hypothetical protein